MADERAIIIRPAESGPGFEISVRPLPSWGWQDAERPTYRAARRFAESLRIVHSGWSIVDETEGSK